MAVTEWMVFDRLTTIRKTLKNRRIYWECRCECGNIRENIRQDHLLSGDTKSCGCIAREVVIARNKANSTHGISDTPEYKRIQHIKHRDKDLARMAKYRKNNSDKIKEAKKRHYEENREKILIARKHKRYIDNANTAERRARKRDATVAWDRDITKKRFQELSKQARELFKTTGVKYHVDHIVPLTGKNGNTRVVCSLHVHNNLQLLPANENCKKSCQFML